MLRQKLLPAIFVVLPATTALMAQSTLVEATVDECRIRPGSATPHGTHWYYRVNRVNNQHCWYLSSADTVVGARGAIANAHRHLARRSTRVAPKQSPQYDRKLRPQTASVQMVPVRTALAGPRCPNHRSVNAQRRQTLLRAGQISRNPEIWTCAKSRRKAMPIPIQRLTRTSKCP